MRVSLYIFLWLVSGMSVFPQGTSELNDLLKNAKENIYTNPNQSLRIAEQILKTATNAYEIAGAHLTLSKSYFVMGNYKNSIEHFYDSKQKSEQITNDFFKIEVLTHGLELFYFLNFFEPAYELEREIKNLSVESAYYENYKKWLEADTLHNSKVLKEMIPLPEAVHTFERIPLLFLESRILNSLGNVAAISKNPDSTQLYFENALYKAASVQKNNFFEMQFLIDYSIYLFELKDYSKAIQNLIKAEEIAISFQNPYFDKKIFEQLAQNYLTVDTKDKFQEYYVKGNNASTASLAQESIAANTIFNVLQNKQNIEKTHLDKLSGNTLIFYGSGLFFMILLWLFIKWFAIMKLNHEKEHISYLKLIQDFDKKEDSPKKVNIKPLGIPKETENAILLKLEKFEKGNKFLARDMSLAQLASQFDTNTKYISEVINKHKERNFNLYVNELRVKYIVNKLKTDPNYLQYKVSYLAEECGFSSHSSFTTVFKNITGISPNVFIELLKKDSKNKISV